MFPVLLVLLPVIIYNRYSPFMAKTWLRIPKDWGITPSIFVVIYLGFIKNSLKILLAIRNRRYLRWSITLVCLIMPFIPHLLSLAIILAFMLESSYFYPSNDMERFYEEHADEADVNEKFIDTYFK